MLISRLVSNSLQAAGLPLFFRGGGRAVGSASASISASCRFVSRASSRHHSRNKGGRDRFRPVYLLPAGVLGFFSSKEEKKEEEDVILDIQGEEEEEKKKKERDNELITMIKYGILATQKGEYDKAESLFHIALKMAQDLDNQDGITYVYDMLANVAFDRGDYMKAERLFKSVLQREIAKGTSTDDNKVVSMSLKLADIYSRWEKDEMAEEGYKFCIDTQKEKLDKGINDEDTLALWGMGRDKYAHYLLSRNKYKTAQRELEAALKICTEHFGETHPQSVVLLNSLGALCMHRDEVDKAVEYLEKAAKLSEEIDSDDRALYMVNLGVAKIRQGFQKAAREACSTGKRLASKWENEDVLEAAKDCLKHVEEMKIGPAAKKCENCN